MCSCEVFCVEARLVRVVDHVPVELVLDERADGDRAVGVDRDAAAVPQQQYRRAEVEIIIERRRERAEHRVAYAQP